MNNAVKRARKLNDEQLADKLVQIIPMLGSDNEAEMLATVAALKRVLASSGKNMNDLLPLVQRSPVNFKERIAADMGKRDMAEEIRRFRRKVERALRAQERL
jgi:hypothetical protein